MARRAQELTIGDVVGAALLSGSFVMKDTTGHPAAAVVGTGVQDTLANAMRPLAHQVLRGLAEHVTNSSRSIPLMK